MTKPSGNKLHEPFPQASAEITNQAAPKNLADAVKAYKTAQTPKQKAEVFQHIKEKTSKKEWLFSKTTALNFFNAIVLEEDAPRQSDLKLLSQVAGWYPGDWILPLLSKSLELTGTMLSVWDRARYSYKDNAIKTTSEEAFSQIRLSLCRMNCGLLKALQPIQADLSLAKKLEDQVNSVPLGFERSRHAGDKLDLALSQLGDFALRAPASLLHQRIDAKIREAHGGDRDDVSEDRQYKALAVVDVLARELSSQTRGLDPRVGRLLRSIIHDEENREYDIRQLAKSVASLLSEKEAFLPSEAAQAHKHRHKNKRHPIHQYRRWAGPT